MVKNSSKVISSHLLDTFVLHRIELASKLSLAASGSVAAIILSGWFIPQISAILPNGWTLMQASTALIILLLSIALVLDKQKSDDRYRYISLFLAFACLILEGIALFENWYGQDAVISSFIASSEMHFMVHPVSIQSASCFLLLTSSLFIDYTRQDRLGTLLDALIITLIMLNLLYMAGYIYSANNLVQESSSILISPQTLLCVALLTFVQAARRAPLGLYSILVSKGIGGHTARILLPTSLFISYAMFLSQTQLRKLGLLALPYDAALTAVALAVILIVVVLLMARKINLLEDRLRMMAITDELTGIHNLRGFLLLGQQELLVAKRSTIPFALLYVDIDGLKNVNDSLGHDVGSQLICDVATLLRDNFRASDIVSRVGGDEFAVIIRGFPDDIDPAINRISRVVDVVNQNGNKPYKIRFSIGKAVLDPQSNESLEELLSRADAEMYENKEGRRALHTDSVTRNRSLQPILNNFAAELGHYAVVKSGGKAGG